MIGIVVAAHGKLADALIEAALMVVPDADRVRAVEITTRDDSHEFEQRLRAAIDSLLPGGVLLLTDMFGGTPSNVGLMLHQPGQVEVLTGANLPMLIRGLQLTLKDVNISAAAHEVKEYGARAIAVASEVLGAGHPMEQRA